MIIKKAIMIILLIPIFSHAKSNIVLISLDDIMIPVVFEQNNTISVLDALKQKYLNAINQARSQTQDCGEYGMKPAVAPLRWNENLYMAAKTHSNDMAQTDTFSHTGSGELTDLVATQNHPGEGSTMQERVEYAGYTSVETVIEGWLGSDGHCRNIMNPRFTEVGMARVDNDDSAYIQYWTQNFGTK